MFVLWLCYNFQLHVYFIIYGIQWYIHDCPMHTVTGLQILFGQWTDKFVKLWFLFTNSAIQLNLTKGLTWHQWLRQLMCLSLLIAISDFLNWHFCLYCYQTVYWYCFLFYCMKSHLLYISFNCYSHITIFSSCHVNVPYV